MWIFIGIVLLIFGIWQAFQLGQSSPILSWIGLLSGIIIVFISSWKIGLALLILFGLFVLFSQIVGNDRKKIKRIILTFKNEKGSNPTASEDAICRKIIASRLYITRISNPIGIKTIDDAIMYVTHIFSEPTLTISKTCNWIITHEKGGKDSISKVKSRQDINSHFEKTAKLDRIIKNYKKQLLA